MARTNAHFDATMVELVLRKAEMYKLEFDLIDFLVSLDSIEESFLMLQSGQADECYVQMILRRRDNLRGLVYRRRHYCMTEKAPYWEEYCDSSLEETEGGKLGTAYLCRN